MEDDGSEYGSIMSRMGLLEPRLLGQNLGRMRRVTTTEQEWKILQS